mgnify:CR=1 FL=1
MKIALIIFELKAVREIAPEHKAQVNHNLKAQGTKLGRLVNFGAYPKATIIRLALCLLFNGLSALQAENEQKGTERTEKRVHDREVFWISQTLHEHPRVHLGPARVSGFEWDDDS